MQVQVSKWGNNLGIRVPKDIAARIGLMDGDRVDLVLDGNRIVISTDRPIYALNELLVGLTPQALHQAFEWGPDQGREDVP